MMEKGTRKLPACLLLSRRGPNKSCSHSKWHKLVMNLTPVGDFAHLSRAFNLISVCTLLSNSNATAERVATEGGGNNNASLRVLLSQYRLPSSRCCFYTCLKFKNILSWQTGRFYPGVNTILINFWVLFLLLEEVTSSPAISIVLLKVTQCLKVWSTFSPTHKNYNCMSYIVVFSLLISLISRVSVDSKVPCRWKTEHL